MTHERPVLPGVDPGVVALAAPDAPAHDADLCPGGAGADGHGATGVTLGKKMYVFMKISVLFLSNLRCTSPCPSGQRRACGP